MCSSLFKRRGHAGVVSVFIHALKPSDLKHASRLLNELRSRVSAAYAYIVFYGVGSAGGPYPIPVYYHDEPYQRGSALFAASRLASSPILVFIDAATGCFNPDAISEAVDSVFSGRILVYMSTPWGSPGLSSRFRDLIREVGLENTLLAELASPGYSTIVVASKLVNKYSRWFIEPFIVLNASRLPFRGVEVDNGCRDVVGLGWMEEFIMSDLKSKLLEYVAARRGVAGEQAVTGAGGGR